MLGNFNDFPLQSCLLELIFTIKIKMSRLSIKKSLPPKK